MKIFTVYSEDSEHLVRGKEELRGAKKELRRRGKKNIGHFECEDCGW